MIKVKVESTGEVMMSFNHLTIEVKARQEELLRDAQRRRLIREAQPTRSASLPAQWLRVVLAIFLIRPF
jgi:hypothetical protein